MVAFRYPVLDERDGLRSLVDHGRTGGMAVDVDGPSPADTLCARLRAVSDVYRALERGDMEAAADALDRASPPAEAAPVNGVLVAQPG